MTEWWRQPQRIVQTNLRLTDASLDPETVARSLVDFGATAMLFNVGGIFAWYPSTLPLQAPNPRLDRDLLGEMIGAAHRHGIKVIGRYDLSKATKIAFDAEPSWFCRDSKGEPFEYNGTYQACVNGGWYREQSPKVLEESLGRYEIDGMFFNMFGYLATDYSYRSYGLCHCENCKRDFRAFSGHDIPGDTSTSNPVYRQYLRFQDITSRELASSIYERAKAIRPGVAISNMGRKSDFFRGEINRRLDRPHPEWVHYSGEQARTFRSVGGDEIRHSAALTHFIDFPWRYSAESAAAQALRLAQQLANGADPHYYFMGPPEQPDRKALPAVRDIFAYYRKHQALYGGLVSEARIGLYSSVKSRRYHPESGGLPLRAFRGAYRALLESGLAFDLIADDRGPDADFVERHSRYATIVLPAVTCLSDAEAASLDAFARNGGTLVVLGPAGIYDETGNSRPASALATLPYNEVRETIASTRGGYLRVDADPLPGLDSDLVMLDGAYQVVKPKAEAEGLYEMLLPQRFGPPEFCFPEPDLASGLPGALIGTAGLGEVIFVPWQPDALYYEHSLLEHRALIARLAERGTGASAVTLNRPDRMEVTLQRHKTDGTLVVHLVNYSGQSDNSYAEPIPAHGLVLTLRGIKGAKARALVADIDIPIGAADAEGAITLELPPVGYFEAITIAQG
ncbi:beta-galactosidase trimerization domain-containing protein [Mesorhizobium sp. ASY16-5R]|uniref:beta-galactosidase trimerization domain-containing protein n=1 Tax=Mesorhizobium sp. ASY16-5R TaxID=3445772 RepID=UPI003FA09001